MPTSWLHALLGGALVGLASAALLLTHGRIAGISGVTGSLLQPTTPDRGWRYAFLGGLVLSGVIASVVAPSAIGGSVRSLPIVILAGALVGFGTRLGSGCTSGHGICGLSRLSARSMVAVVTFITTGVITTMLVGGAA
ncbi:MAG TPA: YeeE/YedE thiosulfate transporter family protein [Kofleriaceae bacterium]